MGVILVLVHLVDPGTEQQRLEVEVDQLLLEVDQVDQLLLEEDQDQGMLQLLVDQDLENHQQVDHMVPEPVDQTGEIIQDPEDSRDHKERATETVARRILAEETLVARGTSPAAGRAEVAGNHLPRAVEDVLIVCWRRVSMLVPEPMLRYLVNVWQDAQEDVNIMKINLILYGTIYLS